MARTGGASEVRFNGKWPADQTHVSRLAHISGCGADAPFKDVIPEPPSLMIGNNVIERVNSFKLLGVWIQDNLK